MYETLSDVNASSEQVVDVQDTVDTTDVETSDVPETVAEVAKPQSTEDNARYAAARREAETESSIKGAK